MKVTAKRLRGILVAALVALVALIAGLFCMKDGKSAMAEEPNEEKGYFYEKLGLNDEAKKFYDLFDQLFTDGTLKKGKVEYDLVKGGVVSSDVVTEYVSRGTTRLPKAYGAGRDSFIMDHPDLFYADLYGTSISAGSMDNDYVAYLDSSRVKSLYLGELDSEAKVTAAVQNYETTINTIVTAAKTKGGVKEQIEYVNEYVCDHTEYSYGMEVVDGRNVDTPAAAYINTAYGALVNGKAICGGYSNAFKAVMDRLEIPCVCIQGYHVREDGTSVPHMWNAVQLDGLWYNVDVTFNDEPNSNNEWLLRGASTFNYNHVQDNIVSTSEFELSYPAINPYDYGNYVDDNGMYVNGEYSDTEDTGKFLEVTISYEDKGAKKLEDEGKYLAYRYGEKEGANPKWDSYWYGIVAFEEALGILTIKDEYCKIPVYPNTAYIQFAVLNHAPDNNPGGATHPDGTPWNFAYLADSLSASDFILQPTTPYENEGYQSYVPAPWGNPVPLNSSPLPVNKTYDIRITYTESLEKIDLDLEPTMEYTVSVTNDKAHENAQLTDFYWDGDKVITFKFTPSKMYEHNLASYNFVPTNLRGVSTKKTPSPVWYSFQGDTIFCNKMLPGGRLYISIFGQPKILDNSDLSVTDFKDEEGNYYAESQRSQLMLVVTKPDEEREQELNDVLMSETSLKEKDVVSSATYEIDLQICGILKQVPNGSYFQVSFGFPEGYSAKDKGTTFKIYHYKHDDAGNITGVEEIPVIITEYGLIAKVASFSPFTVVQVKNSSAAVKDGKKAVYASADGQGSITTDGQSGISFVENDSITYNITPASENYQISHVLLNGKVLEASRYQDGTLTLSLDELEEGNILEAKFVTKEAAQSYADKGIELVAVSAYPAAQLPKSSGPKVAGIVVGVVVAVIGVAGAAIIAYVLLKKKPAVSEEEGEAKSSAPEKKASKVTVKKTAPAKKQSTATEKTTAKKSSASTAKKESAPTEKKSKK